MERGREGRRGSGGGGPVSAPRRPRTSGFKDTSVGEDGEDIMDDAHNPRLRERQKKENCTLHPAQALPPSNLGPSRSKRKRQGSQEIQDQARSSTLDDVDETTEEMEMDGSDDDDDPPPPPIPRRAVKFRPQGKFLEDGLTADLPAVPRKARTAILKRPQEAVSVSVADASSHQGSVIPRPPASSSAPSSSSVVSLKPGRRTKPISSKLRAAKVCKISTQTMISEQEVEVAEALFDLARMFTSQPVSTALEASVDAVHSCKPEREPNCEPENSTNPPSAVSISPPTISTASPAAATFTDSAITVTSPRPFPSPLSSIVVPPAEAPKRKRPRFKNRSDEVGLVSQVPPQGISAVPRSSSMLTSPSSKLKSEQTLNSVTHLTAESIVKMEISAPPFAASSAVSASMTPPGIPPALDLSTICTSVVVRISNSAEKISGLSENVVKEEANNLSMPQEEYLGLIPDQRPAPVPECIRSPQADLMRETETTLHNLSGSVSLASLEPGKRYVQLPNSANDEVGTNKHEIDLKVPLLAKRTLPPESDSTDVSRNASQHVQEKGSVCLPSAALREDLFIDKGRVEETHIEEREMHWGRELGKEPRPELERDRDLEGERQVEEEGENHRELPKELEKELEGAESGKSPPEQKFVKALMADSRTENSQRAASAATTAAAPSSLLSSLAGASSVATSASGSVPTLPLSVGMATWPLGLPPVGYYSSGAAVATNVNWPGGGPVSGLSSVDEHIVPTAQFPHQYLMQARHPQPWKRCASHVYIAHFIDAQQQMNRHPFIQAAYQNSSSLFGGKSYNLNIPLTPAEALFGAGSGGPLIGGTSTAVKDNVVAGGGSCPGLGGVPGTDKNPNASSVKASAQAKDRVFMESVSRKQVVQQLHQPLQISPNLSLQARPGFGFPVAQVGTAGAAAASNGGGTLADPESGGGSTLGGQGSGPTSCSTTVTGLGAGAGNGGVVSHATAQAQYLQAVMQQGAFPYPFQATAHFGPGFSGPGPQQAAQYFSSPFYATHMVHTPTHAQQVQKASIVSAGFVTNDLQHQQVARNCPPGSSSQQQQQPIPPSVSPSLSQQIQTQLSTSQKMQRLVERDGNSGSESNSTNESKFPSLQRNVFTHGSCNVTASVNAPSSMVLGGTTGIHCLQPQDFNLIPGLGGKPTKHLRQSQSASQHLSPLQQQLQQPHQHAGTSAAVQMSLKCTDQQSSHTFSAMPVAAMTRVSTIGPGPLGLAPVASVMAPQGHAMLQSITDSCRSHGQQQTQHHQSVLGQSHQISIPPGQQQQRVGQPQRGVTIATGVEESRPVVEGTVFPNRSGREVIDERKALSKRSSGSALSRVDLDNSVAIPTCGGHPTARMSSNAGPALNLLTSTPAILITRSPGHLTGSSLQQSSPSLALIQSSKQATARSKVVAGSSAGNSVTSTSSQLASFSDRCPLGSSLSNKVSGTTLSLPGQSLAQGSQGLRQGQVTQQHPQLKLSNRGSVGSLPTPSGTAPQAVLAAAIAKSQQGVQQQQPRPQAQVSSNTGSLPRLSSGNLGGLSTSSSVPSKCVPPCTAKSNVSGKNSFSVSQRPSSAVSGKRPTPPSVSNVSSILGPLIQTASTKCQQQPSQNQPLCQQPQNLSQCHTQASQQSPQTLQQSPSQPPQSLTPTHQQYLHQQGHCSTQQLHQMHNQQSLTQPHQPHHMQRQLFLQNPAFQQHQHPAGSQLSSHPQQQAGLRQQSQQQSSHVQTHQQGNLSSSQLQLQPQQHHASPQQHQQHGLQSGPGSLSVKIPSGSLSLGPPVLTLGTGSNGKINNSCWTPGSDGVAASQCSVARSNPATGKVSGSSGITPPGSNLQRSQCGPFLHGQFGSVVSGQQQSSSPQSSSGPQYVQPVANSGGSGIAVDEIGMSGGVARKAESSNEAKL